MNKKAQFFDYGLLLAVFVICTAATVSFSIYNHRTSGSFGDVVSAISIYEEKDNLEIYAKESGKLALQEAYAETIKDMARNCPKTTENVNYAVWTKGTAECSPKDASCTILNNNCLFDNDILNKMFLSHLDTSINKFLRVKNMATKNIGVNEENFTFFLHPIILSSSIEGTAKIDINYTFSINPEFNLSKLNIDLNFTNIYRPVLARWEECKSLDDIVKIRACMSLDLKNWKLQIINPDFLSELRSKESYYSKGTLEHLIIKFKLEK
jgi:hypothetical protein